PYLRQHADNPVHWQPWDDEAFAEARQRDVPVLVSIGYSACHWCHVMAHESFEDETTAKVMNELFVNVKVDREERPDVDAIYMDATQAMTGHGGWPMTVFCTPEGRPFHCGTYFPKDRRGGMPAFVDVLHAVDDAWRTKRSAIEEQAGNLTEHVSRTALIGDGGDGALPGAEGLTNAFRAIRQHHDDQWGGFGQPPKFPQTMSLDLLLRAHLRNGSADPLRAVITSLDCMSSGGIYDHLGGGFARYSVDNVWLVPHFEKMLYDQALLARVYLHAWQVTGEDRFLQVLDETIGYVLRDLRDPGGGFYSAEDADSEGEEGKFYVWDHADVLAIGGDEAVAWYGVTAAGNFEGANILHRPVRADLLRPAGVEEARQRLFSAREQRVRPGLDDKVLTEWNAMFVSALAEAAAALDRDDWREAASASGRFLLSSLRREEDGRWLRSWQRDGGARHLAYAVDHAWLVDAFTRLAEATGEASWIAAAREAAGALVELFVDPDGAGFFTVGRDAEQLIVRQKDLFDGATPSANSVAATALLRLAALTGEPSWAERAAALVGSMADLLRDHPAAFAHLLGAVDLLAEGAMEIVVAGGRPDLVRAVQGRYLPNAVLAWGEPYDSPLWEGRTDGHAYVCRDFACKLPADSTEALLAQLG
ncbi:MAG: thioredoxin domain-containing protein, partial [Acidimicrobiales bacterium]